MDREAFEKRKKVVKDLVHDKHYVPMKRKEMAMLFNLPKEQRGELYEILDILVAEGAIGLTKKGKYCKTETTALTGLFESTQRGFGFVTVEGEEVTMTWQAWSSCMAGTGKYANASNETKLAILAGIEENFLEQYYCIPLCTYTACSMLSYKLNCHTEVYSIMYGFGGLRLMNYNYSDAEWADYVASQGGTVGY